MSRLTRIVVVGGRPGNERRWADALAGEAVEVQMAASPGEADEADLVLIEADAQPDVTAAVRAYRRSLPLHTPVLVLGQAAAAAAAIDAGATDSVNADTSAPVLSAHVRRLVRQGESLKRTVNQARSQAARESLTLAAADLAVPLGELVDGLESAMARVPADANLDELLELTGRAVEAMDRLRQMAIDPGERNADHDGLS